MHKTNIIHKLDSLFILLVFGVFAVVSLLLVAIGAGMYQRVVDHLSLIHIYEPTRPRLISFGVLWV